MSTLGASVAIGTVVVASMAAAAYGFGVVDMLAMADFDSEGLDCSHPLVPFEDPSGTAGVLVDNVGNAVTARICIYDSDRQKRVDDWVDLAAGTESGFAYDVERRILAVILVVENPSGGGGRSANVVSNRACEATITYIRTNVRDDGTGIGSGDDGPDCGQITPSQRAEIGQGQIPVGFDEGFAGGRNGSLAVAGTLTIAVPLLVWRRRVVFLALGLFTRLQRPKVLDQETRARIHELIQVEPGIHAAEISERLELSGSHVLHHLRVLAQQEIIVGYRGFGRRHYFVRGRFPPHQMRELSAFRHDTLRRVFHVVRANPGMSLSEVSRRAGVSLPRTSRLVGGLAQAGLVRKTSVGREVRLEPVA